MHAFIIILGTKAKLQKSLATRGISIDQHNITADSLLFTIFYPGIGVSGSQWRVNCIRLRVLSTL